MKPFKLTPAPGPTEHDIQATFIRMCRLHEVRMPLLRLAFAVPNGGYALSKAAAGKLYAAGLRAGVPDWILPVPCGGYAGLALEFKRPHTGRLSEQQECYLSGLMAIGWQVAVVTDAAEAMDFVLRYLSAGLSLPVATSRAQAHACS
jgi:hypothetical protein